MKSPNLSRFTKVKILAAYSLLIAVGGWGIAVVLWQFERDSETDSKKWTQQERNALTSSILYHLYKSESDGLLMLYGNNRKQQDYCVDIRIIQSALDSLKLYTSDSVQHSRIDSISALVALKETSLRNLLYAADIETYHAEVDKRISDLMPDSNDIKRHIVAESVVSERRDTIITKRSTGNFLTRIKGVFKKTKTDSTIVTTENIQTDSIHVSLADSISTILSDLKTNVIGMQNESLVRQREIVSQLTAENDRINKIIYRLIQDFTADESAMLLREIGIREQSYEKATNTLKAFLICAIVLIVFFVIVIWKDLNRNSRYRERLELLNQENERLLNAREQIMLAITHDIKAPLGSIMGYTDLLDRLIEGKRAKLYLSNIRSSSNLLLALVSDLLEFYKLDSNKEELRCVAFNPQELLLSIYNLFVPVALNKHIQLKNDIQIDSGMEVETDPLKIKQVVNNLLSNALKFTDHGYVKLSATVSQGILSVSVEDTGRGISIEEQDKLFSSFVRLSSSKGVQGFGLGLSIVKRTVALLGGDIDVNSEQGKGSVFSVRIPVNAVVSPGRESKLTDSVQTAGCLAGHCRILLIDDDDLQMELVREICKRHGIDADKCQYPEYADQMLRNVNYDLVITDIQMPGCSGFDVLEAVKKNQPDMPVIAVTARSVEDQEAYLEAGFAAVLTKPFKESELIELINKESSVSVCLLHSEPRKGIEALTMFAEDDEDAKKEIVNSFISQTEKNIETLRIAFLESDAEQVKALCHKMLPIFTMIEETEITDILKKYELDFEKLPFNAEETAFLVDKIQQVIDTAKKELK